MLDRWFPPEKRESLWAKITQFATEKPMLASFLLSQIALSGIPLALFAVMTVGVLAFSLVAALVVAVLGALLFSVFCIGVALIILLPTLFITTFAAAFIWLWGIGAYYILKWFNEKDLPGIHTGVAEGQLNQSGLKDIMDDLPNLHGNGEATGPREYNISDEDEKDQDEKPQLQPQKKMQNGEKEGSVLRSSSPNVTKTANPQVGNVTKKASVGNVTKKVDVGGVTKTVDGVKGQVPVVGGMT